MEFSINVFTLNCWGMPLLAKNRIERLEALITYLNASSHDFVCLQEIWYRSDYSHLKDKLNNVFPYGHYFYSGVFGSGLCIFSRWLIQDVFFHRYSLNGYMYMLNHRDWYGGKGIGLCRIQYHDKLVNVYCTHLHANYDENDIYLTHRVLQGMAAGEFVKATIGSADISVLAGDLNTVPGELAFRLIKQIPCLQDPYDLPCDHLDPQVRPFTGTDDNISNSYADPVRVLIEPEGKRIDHIMFRVKDGWQARVIDYGNPLPDRIPNQSFSYSDHFALTLKLQLKSAPASTERSSNQNGVYSQEMVLEAIALCQEAKERVHRKTKIYLTLGGVSLIFRLGAGVVDFWPQKCIFDFIKFVSTGFSFYFLLMGSLWNMTELNCLDAGLSDLNVVKSHVCFNV